MARNLRFFADEDLPPLPPYCLSRFSGLPQEIQDLIWLFALPGPRLIEVFPRPSTWHNRYGEVVCNEWSALRCRCKFKCNQPLRISQVCRASRRVAERHGSSFLSYAKAFKGALVNWELDTIYIGPRTGHLHNARFLLELRSDEALDKIRNLAIDEAVWEATRHIHELRPRGDWRNFKACSPAGMIQQIPGLKTLTIVGHGTGSWRDGNELFVEDYGRAAFYGSVSEGSDGSETERNFSSSDSSTDERAEDERVDDENGNAVGGDEVSIEDSGGDATSVDAASVHAENVDTASAGNKSGGDENGNAVSEASVSESGSSSTSHHSLSPAEVSASNSSTQPSSIQHESESEDNHESSSAAEADSNENASETSEESNSTVETLYLLGHDEWRCYSQTADTTMRVYKPYATDSSERRWGLKGENGIALIPFESLPFSPPWNQFFRKAASIRAKLEEEFRLLKEPFEQNYNEANEGGEDYIDYSTFVVPQIRLAVERRTVKSCLQSSWGGLEKDFMSFHEVDKARADPEEYIRSSKVMDHYPPGVWRPAASASCRSAS